VGTTWLAWGEGGTEAGKLPGNREEGCQSAGGSGCMAVAVWRCRAYWTSCAGEMWRDSGGEIFGEYRQRKEDHHCRKENITRKEEYHHS
jgi:hypothetical protein